MRSIERVFSELRGRHEGGLIAYVTAGDPDLSCTPHIVEALVKGGADIVELGIPFSDPIADGPTIQAAMVRALRAGTTPKAVLETCKHIKKGCGVPIVLLTYYNPVFRMGLESFFRLANCSGVDGIIVPDLPIEEALDYRETSESYGVDTIFLAAPSTSTERLQRIVDYTSGFLYLVSVFGVTGTRKSLQDSTIQQIRRVQPYTRGRVPLAVGFGISRPEHTRAVIEGGADAAIVGSEFVSIVQRKQGNVDEMVRGIEDKARVLKEAMKQVKPTTPSASDQ